MSNADEQFQKIYNRMIPFIIIIPVLFLILFIVVSMVQLNDINSRIEEGQSQTIKEIISRQDEKSRLSEADKQFITLAVLEEESLSERYRQGHYSLVSRSFKQFLGFFTGIMMVIVGSVFVLLKLREEINTSASRTDGWKVSLVTSSPGVVFGIVGAILISIASTTKDTISVRDTGLYLTREYLVAPFFSQNKSQQNMDEYMKSQDKEKEAEEDKNIPQHPTAAKGAVKKAEPAADENIKSEEKLMIQHPPKSNQ